MVRMGNYNLCDEFQGLWHEIDQCHLTYLDMEESPEKFDQRSKLEGNTFLHYIIELIAFNS